jgi:hypothetical protein
MYMKFKESSNPPPNYKTYKIDQYLITRILYNVGDWNSMEYIGAGLVSEMKSQHIQVSGRRVCVDGNLPDMVAGSMTAYDNYEIPEGTYKRVCTEAAELWCLRDKLEESGDTSAVSSLKMLKDQQLTINSTQKAFLIFGELTIGTKTAIAPIVITTTELKTAVCKSDIAYLFLW